MYSGKTGIATHALVPVLSRVYSDVRYGAGLRIILFLKRKSNFLANYVKLHILKGLLLVLFLR